MTAHNSREVGRRPLKWRVATRRPRKTLLVFCEGERTEPEYLNALKRQPSVHDVAAADIRVQKRQGGAAEYARRGARTAHINVARWGRRSAGIGRLVETRLVKHRTRIQLLCHGRRLHGSRRR